jgi:nucleoside-diphosphate kinase
MIQQTLSIIKPDGVKRGVIGNILNRFESAGLQIKKMRMLQLTKAKAEEFYAVHKDKGFFDELTTFMASGQIVATLLEGENAIEKNRQIMGATNPEEAEAGTIRKDFSQSVGENTVHGSDAEETAKAEIQFFFGR